MRILVTRPEVDAHDFAEAVVALGHEPVLAPLMEIEFSDMQPAALPEHQAVVLTSANGARAAALGGLVSEKPCFAVGPATAAAARVAGYSQIFECGGDVLAVVSTVKAQLIPQEGKIVHIAGTIVAGDLKDALEADGFEVDRLVLYAARAVGKLPRAAKAFLTNASGAPENGIAFFSPRTAGLFVTLVAKAGLSDALSHCQAYCLSVAVADKIAAAGFGDVCIAQEPHQEALLDLMGAQ